MLGTSRLSRYLAAELVTPTMLGLLGWTFILLMNHFFYVAERALSKNLGADLTLRLFLTGLPAILILSIPMSVLLGCLVAMGRLSADHEWVALQGAGQSPWRVLRPLVVHGLLASLLGFFVYSELAPRANYARRDLQGEILFSSNLAADLKPRVFYTELHDAVLFVDDIQAGSDGRLEGVLLIRHYPRKNSFELILARSGDLYPTPDRSGTLIIDLYNGVLHAFEPESPETYNWFRSFAHVREPFHPPEYLKNLLQPPDKVVSDMRLGELLAELRAARVERRETVARLRAAGGKTNPNFEQDRFLVDNRVRVSTVELSSRIALPLASLCFAVLALPLGITRARSGKGAGFAVSLLVILVYWATYTFFRDWSLTGEFPAALGPWVANLVIVPWAAFGLWRMRRPAEPGAGPVVWTLRQGYRLVRRAIGLLVVRRRRRPGGDANLPEIDALENLSGTPNRYVARLDQYIAVSYVRWLVLAMAAAYLVYGLVELKGLTDGLLRTKQPASLLLRYFEFFAPSVFHIILPVSCLVGAIVAVTLLSRSGELTAIKSAGISLRRAIVPVLAVTSLLCGLLFVIQERVAPATNRKAQAIEDQILGRAPKTYGMPAGGRWGFGPDGRRLYHYRLYDADRNEFQAFTVLTLDRAAPRVIDHRYAKRARWLGSSWELQDGWYRSFNADGSLGKYEVWDGVRNERMDAPTELTTRESALSFRRDVAEQMSLAELQEEIVELEASGYDTTRLRVAFHGKVARSLAPLVMVLLGLPFAFRVGRRGSLYGIGVALVLVLIYWAVFATFNALGLQTLLEPWPAAWAPNVLFGLFGAYLLLYVRT